MRDSRVEIHASILAACLAACDSDRPPSGVTTTAVPVPEAARVGLPAPLGSSSPPTTATTASAELQRALWVEVPWSANSSALRVRLDGDLRLVVRTSAGRRIVRRLSCRNLDLLEYLVHPTEPFVALGCGRIDPEGEYRDIRMVIVVDVVSGRSHVAYADHAWDSLPDEVMLSVSGQTRLRRELFSPGGSQTVFVRPQTGGIELVSTASLSSYIASGGRRGARAIDPLSAVRGSCAGRVFLDLEGWMGSDVALRFGVGQCGSEDLVDYCLATGNFVVAAEGVDASDVGRVQRPPPPPSSCPRPSGAP